MPETLLTPSSIKLFGRLLKGLNFTNDTFPFGGNYFLQRQLAAIGTINLTASTQGGSSTVTVTSVSGLANGQSVTGDPAIIPGGATIANVPPIKNPDVDPTFDLSTPALQTSPGTQIIVNTGPANFARIYAFSFEGAIYSLPRPTLFLVHGTGLTIDADNWRGNRSSLDQSGVIAREWEFSGDKKLSYWEYEKGDFSIRLDTEAGPFDQILLAAALRSGADMADRSGQGLGIRSGQGLDVRSGQGLDVRSGQGLRTGR
jgi:hypothetical protein